MRRIELRPFSLYFIFGPRQVGKTTLIKLLTRDLLEKTHPKAIFYFKCDELSDFKELDDVIEEYLKMRRLENIRASYIFLDEVSFPKEWQRSSNGMWTWGTLKTTCSS